MTSRFVALLLATAAFACGGSGDESNRGEPVVISTYPIDGQVDVPVGTRLVIGFSAPIEANLADELSVVGPEGVVPGTAAVVGERAIHFAGAFDPGTDYQLHLGDQTPLLTFTTRRRRPIADSAPVLVSLNSDGPHPFVDFTTLRALFSEPIATGTLVYGDTVALRDPSGALVPAALLSDGIHLSIDPTDDLDADVAYSFELGPGIVDLSGEPLPEVTRTITPLDSRGGVGLVHQTLRALPQSSIEVEKPLVSVQTLSVEEGAIHAELADASLFGGPIPFTIRRGEVLTATGLDIAFSGAVPSNVDTGVVGVRFISDATGVIYRNPYRPDQPPREPDSPLFFELAFDVGMYSNASVGNAIVSQNVLHVSATGTATAGDGVLTFDTIAGLEVDLLGVSTGNGNLNLVFETDPERPLLPPDAVPPVLVSSYPEAGQLDFPPTASPMLLFDEPIDDRVANAVTLRTAGGVDVPVQLRSIGGALLTTPLAPLDYGEDYIIEISAAGDLAGNRAASQTVAFSTPVLADSNVAPALTALRPGAPCALVGATPSDSGRCSSSGSGEIPYRPFTIGPEEPAEATFTQPIDPTTLELGIACGGGSVRIEEIGTTGACINAVPGALVVLERGFRFVPDVPWQVGKDYRLTLVSGTNNTCNAGEICGGNGLPFNSDVLSGSGGGSGGGPQITVPFTVNTADYPGAYIPIELTPATDVNGSGFVATSELAQPANRVVFRVASTSGVVDDARFTDTDCVAETPEVEGCLYVSGTVPILLEEAATNCTIATGPAGPITADTCVPLILTPQIFFATSANLEADVLLLSPDVTIGQVILRIVDRPERPARAYIYEANGETRLGGDLELYVDAPNMDISIPGSGHDLRGRLLPVSLDGPVTFFDDGRVRINMANTLPISLAVAVDFLNIGVGGLELEIPTGGLTLQLVSPLIRSGEAIPRL